MISNIFLAMMDSSIYIATGAGIILRYAFLNQKDVIKTFMITGIIYALSFFMFGLSSITHILTLENIKFIALPLLLSFGFFQMNSWPVCIVILHDYYNNK